MLKDFPDWTLYMENIFLAIYVCLTLKCNVGKVFKMYILAMDCSFSKNVVL